MYFCLGVNKVLVLVLVLVLVHIMMYLLSSSIVFLHYFIDHSVRASFCYSWYPFLFIVHSIRTFSYHRHVALNKMLN